MTLWAKKIVSVLYSTCSCSLWLMSTQSLGQATIYSPPHCLNFDHGPMKKQCVSSSGSIPKVHVTIQNVAPNPIMGPGCGTTSEAPASSVRVSETPVSNTPSDASTKAFSGFDITSPSPA